MLAVDFPEVQQPAVAGVGLIVASELIDYIVVLDSTGLTDSIWSARSSYQKRPFLTAKVVAVCEKLAKFVVEYSSHYFLPEH